MNKGTGTRLGIQLMGCHNIEILHTKKGNNWKHCSTKLLARLLWKCSPAFNESKCKKMSFYDRSGFGLKYKMYRRYVEIEREHHEESKKRKILNINMS